MIDHESRKRELRFEAMQAIRKACRDTHGDGAGGQAICVCGAPMGGSAACRMLQEFVSTIQSLPTKGLPALWMKHIEDLREVL